MGFSTTSRIVLSTKVLAAGVIDGNESGAWYNSNFSNEFVLDGSKVWTEISNIPVATNLAAAQTNATLNPTLIQDLSISASAIRLTPIAGTNGSTFVGYTTYNDRTSARLDNWINPSQRPRTDAGFEGFPSFGYQIVLYEGDPAGGGVQILTTVGETGVGENRSQGWIFNYALGMLIVAADTRITITNPYVMGFRYIGKTVADLTSGSLSQGEHINIIHSAGTITAPSTYLYVNFFGAETPTEDLVKVYFNGLDLEWNATPSLSPWSVEGSDLRIRPANLNYNIENGDLITAYLLKA